MSIRAVVFILAAAVITASLSACMPASEHAQRLHSADERQFTLGVVQARIKQGMAQAEVAEALGSPNQVMKDEAGDEAWVYDKIATEASYSSDEGGVVGLGGAGGEPGSTLLLGGLLSSYSRSAGAAASTQRTLTVVIKFNRQQRVKSFSYHSSQF